MPAAHHDWRSQAACTSHDPELFFPIGSTGPALGQLEQARQVCRSCPARLPCLEWAIGASINDGIWGGLSETERQSLRRRRRSGRLKGSDLLAAADTVVTPQAASRLRTLNAANLLQPQG
jgi:WhiB family transcriptional regulator, redox-sensing transcriptional regulator